MNYTPEEIKRAREDAYHMTQTAFADYLGVSLRTLAAWEAGETSPGTRAGQRAVERAFLKLPRLEEIGKGIEDLDKEWDGLNDRLRNEDLAEPEIIAIENRMDEIADAMKAAQRQLDATIGQWP